MADQRPYAPAPYDWTLNQGAELSAPAFKLYHMLIAHSNHKTGLCDPGQVRLAALVKCKPRRIRQLIEELTKARLVRIQHYRDGKTSVYFVVQPKDTLWVKPGKKRPRSDKKSLAEMGTG